MRARPRPARITAAAAAFTITAAGLLLPTAASAASPVGKALSGEGVCAVTEASISWGFKESFRSYISGSIAHGSWEAVDGATYETPVFGFTTDEGEWDPEAGLADVPFAGGINFSGHNGLLDTRVSNPVLLMTGPGAGVLQLDFSSVPMADAIAGREVDPIVTTEVPMITIDLSGAVVESSGDTTTFSVVDAPTLVTEEGFAAFSNYETGTAFDPMTIQMTATCAPAATVAPTPSATTSEPEDESAPVVTAAPEEAGSADLAWLPWAIGGAVVVVAVVVGGILASRRRPGSGADGGTGGAAG